MRNHLDTAQRPMTAMATPPHHTAVRENAYEPIQPSIQDVALPSIRQAIPELRLSIPSRDSRSKRASPGFHPGPAPRLPDDVYSPIPKRRKLKEDNASVNASQFQPPRHSSPGQRSQPDGPRSLRGQAYYVSPRNAPAPSIEYHVHGRRASLPSFSASIPFERDSEEAGYLDDYNSHAPLISFLKPHHYGKASYSYSHAHNVPYGSPSPTGPYECAPFPSGGRYGNEMGIVGMVPDRKRRKRHGNLPMETTDKLRAWLHILRALTLP